MRIFQCNSSLQFGENKMSHDNSITLVQTQTLDLGLLVEADPSYYTQVLGKNRKAWSINACLSPYNSTSFVSGA